MQSKADKHADCIMAALDTSTKSTGIAIYKNGILDSTYLINYSKVKDTSQRIMKMSTELLNFLGKLKPDIIYIEDMDVIRNAITMRHLMLLQGVVYAWCIRNDCEFNLIKPTVWRKELGFRQGKKERQDLKEQAVNYAASKYGIEKGDDVADAVCIGDAVISIFARISPM